MVPVDGALSNVFSFWTIVIRIERMLLRFAWEFNGLPIGWDNWVKRDASDPYNIAWAPEGVTLEETWLGLEDVHAAGLVKNIGVSNYSAVLLMDLLRYAKRVKPAVHQFECHPMFQRKELNEIGRNYGIHTTMYSILGSGKEGPLQDSVIMAVAEKHNVGPGAICIAWGLSNDGCSILAKSTNADRIAKNFAADKVKLDAEDLKKIAALDKDLRTCNMEEYWEFASHV